MLLTVALVGMPGSGKSTVGRHLARHLGLGFVDTDHEIERRIGGSIRGFFEAEGEAAFRDLEQQVIAELTSGAAAADPAPGDATADPSPQGRVIATGGGAVLREANRQALREHATVFYLRTTPEELSRRLRHDTHRPLLQGVDPHRRLREMFRERDPLYRRCAHYVIETGRPSVPSLINMVLMQLELAGLADPARAPRPLDAPSGPAGGR